MTFCRFLPTVSQVLSSLLLALIGMGCQQKASTDEAVTTTSGPALFTLLAPEKTHVTFSNDLAEGLNTNVLMYEYFYNGGGVAAGDVNGDGLDDLYFSANMTANRLYLNKGKMAFDDVTQLPGWRAGRGRGKPACPWPT